MIAHAPLGFPLTMLAVVLALSLVGLVIWAQARGWLP